MRGFKIFKGSDTRCPSIHFLFYHISEIVKERIHDAPTLGTFLVGLLAEKNEQNNFLF